MRPSTCAKLALAALGAAALVWTSVASAVQVPGGGSARSDCYARFEVDLPAATSTRAVQCMDGDAACDRDGQCNDSCRFGVQLCLNAQDNRPTCIPPAPPDALTSVQVKGGVPLEVPALNGSACGALLDLDVAVKVKRNGNKRPGKQKIRVVARSPARPKKDKDQLTLTCQPNPSCTPTPPPDGQCPANTTGGPDTLRITVLPSGSDLDNGWTGVSHNFPVPSETQVTFCLSGCDASGSTPCTTMATTGQGTPNTQYYGPPLPLVAGGVPVCVINRYQATTLTGTANLVTGEIQGDVPLFSDVYVSDITRVCPQCTNGTCDSGAARGQQCQVDGTVQVVNSLAANKTFRLSRSCLPGGTPVSTLNITLPLTTGTVGTPGTAGSKPCREREAQGVPVKDNDCAGPCNCAPNACQVGTPACSTMIPDPVDPGEMICQDQKGGLTQCCCSNNPGLSCHPTEAGGIGIQRTGRPVPPTPAAPDPSFPKTAEGTVLAATFCEAATGNANIDTVTGLPGPGALLLNTRAEFLKAQ